MRDVSILIQALPYIRQFRDTLFIVKLGGALLADHDHLDGIARDLTLIHMVGIRLVVVHGGGPQANELSQLLGFEPQLVGGRRVTDRKALEVAKMVFAGKLNTELLSLLQRHGSRGVGISGIDAGLIRAHKRPLTMVVEDGEEREVDFGFVGDVDGVDPTVVLRLVEEGFIPVVSSLAADSDGNILNVNADTIASELAHSIACEKLVLMTSVDGVYRDFPNREGFISQMTAGQAQGLMDDGIASKGMRPKLTACCRALAGGVREAHILNGLTDHSLLLEIFTRDGIGTMIVPD